MEVQGRDPLHLQPSPAPAPPPKVIFRRNMLSLSGTASGYREDVDAIGDGLHLVVAQVDQLQLGEGGGVPREVEQPQVRQHQPQI